MRKFFALLTFLMSGASFLTSQSVSFDDAEKFYVTGRQTISKIVQVYNDDIKGNFWHDWYVIEYSDGFCIFNRFKRKRTINDVINHSIGQGDCDWWVWPEHENIHVCLRTFNDATYLVEKHGKILNIRGIDHPTGNCGD